MAAACSHGAVARARPPASLLLALFALLSVPTATPGAGPPKRQDLRDVRLTLYARRALMADDELAPLNLFVRVDDGVATLSGPVPSKELAARAARLVGEVQGIYEVRNDFRVVPQRAEESLRGLLAGLAAAAAGKGGPPSSLPTLSGLDDEGSGLGGALAGERPPPEFFSACPDALPREVEAPRFASAPRTGVSLGAPVAAGPPPSAGGAATLQSPHAAAPGRTVSQSGPATSDLQAAVRRLRDGDARFLNMQFEVREGVITLSGFAARPEHVIELAGAVARLPEVRRVDVHLVRTRR